uniref:Uncharacterized protein n=1 Tax=Romanomermis culicivorax TaxID=13658 RepID=A0A915IAI3_ROMCU
MLYYIIIFGLLACGVQHSDSLFQDVVIASNETKITTIDGRDLGDQESPVDSRKLSSSNVERQDRLGSYWNRFRQQRKQNTDLKCDYSIKKDLSGCQQTKDGCQKLIEISSSSRLQNCRNFTYWTICPDDSCPKIQQRSKNAPWLNHECGYQFIRGPCERQQPGNSCSRNNVFKPTNQGRNCNPMDFVESCDPEECDDSDQEVVADYETNSKPKAECVYRASRNYCRYHVLQSQKEV